MKYTEASAAVIVVSTFLQLSHNSNKNVKEDIGNVFNWLAKITSNEKL